MNNFNDHFGSIVNNHGLDHWDDHSLSPTMGSDRIENIIKRYKNYSSIKNIKAKFNSFRSFSFQPVLMEEVKTVIWNMKNNKSLGGKIPIQILKESEFTFEILTNCIKKSIEAGCFTDISKEAKSTSFLKKMIRLINLITGLLAFYLWFQKCTKDWFIINYRNTPKVFKSYFMWF